MTIDKQDKLHELQIKLDFILRALACLASDETDEGMRPTTAEAYAGCVLGQEICEKMVEISNSLFQPANSRSQQFETKRSG